MPCLGSRKKKKSATTTSTEKTAARDQLMQQMKSEYHDLKSKNDEHLDVIARQSAELARLREQLDTNKSEYSSFEQAVVEMEKRNAENLQNLLQKEKLLQDRETELEQVILKMDQEGQIKNQLAEKSELLQTKEEELNSLKLQWQKERAELVRPALDEVTSQLDQLKRTNEEVQKRLAEKEGEIAELRSELTRRERRPNSKGQDERQKRLNRLTVDLENDRLMIQKLEELNQQLEAQKQQHEEVLQAHAEVIAEKDRELIEHQQSLSQIKSAHQQAIRTLEQKQTQSLLDLKLRHEADTFQLKERLGKAEKQAKNEVDDEVEKLLREFEQSEHDHTQQLASMERSHKEQLSTMRQDQKAEIRHHIRKRNSMIITNNNPLPTSNKVLRWPTAMNDLQPDLIPKDPRVIHVYVSSVSANPSVKRKQETIQTLLATCNIPFQVIDVARREQALQHMRRQTQGQATQLPLVFVGGQFKGQLDDVVEAHDSGTLEMFLSQKLEGEPRTSKSGSRPSAIPVPSATHSTSKSLPNDTSLTSDRHLNSAHIIIDTQV
ncbi:hypothetical protein DM01DRAFT_1396320 [Hesseltinella vesiculosa]|uniref:Uncharacterized protein n=1 Tax=Hesseltinella vesiculosa TaxID=101127 RepID=A0A1X2G846_9FUNG|nr:hypothetical protein DM01DRAFT_1396320 [Hesseltinella vesiculosa]